MMLNWNFLRGWVVQTKKLLLGGCGYFWNNTLQEADQTGYLQSYLQSVQGLNLGQPNTKHLVAGRDLWITNPVP